ncbi:MAG: pyruvate kinase [Candidatus Nanopelagicales bacterium]
MRRAKIVATLGPATDSKEVVTQLIKSGMNVARLNMSHGDVAEHQQRLDLVRSVSDELHIPVAVLADLQGPKIRIGRFKNGREILEEGENFSITTKKIDGSATSVSTSYSGIVADVSVGDELLIDDGRIKLRVKNKTSDTLDCEVIEGGTISDNKGLNLPGVMVSVPALSEKDELDLRWALDNEVDWIALSFVRNAADIDRVHEIMDEKNYWIPTIAKIEKPQAVDNLDEILDRFDGIMIARGDLGVELPLEMVPLVQKDAITRARNAGKPVLVATQMLESMISASRPTRAEASDVANAILDGADALMLSGETSVGENPALVVATMAKVIEHVEREALDKLIKLQPQNRVSVARALTASAIQVGEFIGAKYLIAFSETGRSARLMARHRSQIPILTYTPLPRVLRQLSLLWGVTPYLVGVVHHTDEMVDQVDRDLIAHGLASEGELVVIVAGVPPGIPGTTNGMRVHKVGFGSKES